VHLKKGALREALADYNTALDINPKHASALWGRGLARLKLGESRQAERDFFEARSLNPAIEREYAEYGLN
jgi:Flp pilus assembly protein TadD